jgi:hypothetical protein
MLHIGGRGGGLVNYRQHFLDAGGYNEAMRGWGRDDSDFFNRLRYGFDIELIKTRMQPYAKNLKNKQVRNANVPTHIQLTDNNKLAKNALVSKRYVANQGIRWGEGLFLKNFIETVSLNSPSSD